MVIGEEIGREKKENGKMNEWGKNRRGSKGGGRKR